MFTEPFQNSNAGGWIEVICGCMFSGKTEELIRRINRAKIANQKIIVFKPKIDNRYHDENVVSHNENMLNAIVIEYAKDIISKVNDQQIVALDEAQFFDNEIVEVCNSLANDGKRIIIAGLDMDSNGKPFGPMPYLLAVAEFVTKLHAICAVSGNLASYSFRKNESKEPILVGANEHYEPRSRKYFFKSKG
ncbi:MAG: thymidine kinase [Bacteroidota bacterium]|nr:thymidine kinase [Bacteroidota bacterium]